MPDRDADRRDLEAALEIERSNAAHWRAVAEQRGQAVSALRHRPSVRVLLAVERRMAPLKAGARRRTAAGRELADRYALAARALRRRPDLPDRRRRLADVIASADDGSQVDAALGHVSVVIAGPRSGPWPLVGVDGSREVIVVDDTAPVPGPGVVHLASPTGESVAARWQRGIERSSGEVVCLLAGTTEPLNRTWLSRLVAALGAGAAAAGPVSIHPERASTASTPVDLRVRAAGHAVVVGVHGPGLEALDVGAAPGSTGAPRHAVVTGAAIVTTRAALDRVGGVARIDDSDLAAADLTVRLAAVGAVAIVRDALVLDHRPVPSVRALGMPIAAGTPAARTLVDRHGPRLRRWTSSSGAGSAPIFAITVSAPSAKIAARWGDWHLATALADSLRRRGQTAAVHTLDRVDDIAVRGAEVHIVLRGLAPVRRTAGQRHVLWIISHPEAIDIADCDAADLVLVASERFADNLRARTATPVEVMLQATDHRRFRPQAPDPARAHDVVIVAKTREQMRRSVADALAAGLRPAIYGGGWEGMVAPELIAATHVPNEQLARVYNSAGVVINDHWETMRTWGFVSNRLFDVLGCGVPVISDHLPELEPLFGGAVPTYRDPDELGSLVADVLADRPAARRRAFEGRGLVLAGHTFDQRAEELLAHAVTHGLIQNPDGGR